MQALRYAIDESLKSLWRGRQSSLLATVTIAVALFVLGAFLLVTTNLDRLGAEWSSAAEMSVYLADSVTPEERRAIEAALQPGGVVAGYTYVSKADALVRFKQTFADMSTAVDALGDNPLPASYDVKLGAAPPDDSGVETIAARLKEMPGVADVRYDRQWLNRLWSAVRIIRTVGLVLGAVLSIAAALTVANVVRLALYARRDEIDIMQLVGAPHVFIRGPFIMEGVFQGGLGALAALVGLGVAFVFVRSRVLAPLASSVNLSSVRFLSPELCAALVVGGMAVGCFGGLAAAWSKG